MRLSYRGTQFDSVSATFETSETGMMGKYRGNDVSFRAPHAIAPQSALPMQYRGINYLGAR